MIQLHIIIYATEEGDRFKVMLPVEGEDDLLDVTDQYEVAATTEEVTGRTGFSVLKKQTGEDE